MRQARSRVDNLPGDSGAQCNPSLLTDCVGGIAPRPAAAAALWHDGSSAPAAPMWGAGKGSAMAAP